MILIFNNVLWPHVTVATMKLSAGSPREVRRRVVGEAAAGTQSKSKK